MILHRTANRSLPTSSPLAALPQLFTTYFSDKISKLHFNQQTKASSIPALSLPSSPRPLLHSFTPATLLEIDNLLSQSYDSYHTDLDPVPTTNEISPTILSIVNLSITTGTFPFTLKSSIISDCWHFLSFTTMVHFISLIPHICHSHSFTYFSFISFNL